MHMPAAVYRKVAALWGEISPAAMNSHQKSCTRSSPVNPAASSHTVNSLFNKLSTWSYSWHLTAFEESAYFKHHWEGKPMTHRTSPWRRSPQVSEFGLLLLLQFRKGQLSISSGKDVSFNSCRTWRISRAFQHMNWREQKARDSTSWNKSCNTVHTENLQLYSIFWKVQKLLHGQIHCCKQGFHLHPQQSLQWRLLTLWDAENRFHHHHMTFPMVIPALSLSSNTIPIKLV